MGKIKARTYGTRFPITKNAELNLYSFYRANFKKLNINYYPEKFSAVFVREYKGINFHFFRNGKVNISKSCVESVDCMEKILKKFWDKYLKEHIIRVD